MAQQRDIEAREREAKALTLRKQGLTYRQIAERVGYSHHFAAQRAIRRALANTIQEPADELRNLELERLDAMRAAIWPQVEKGRLVAVDRALRIMERRAQLLGLDAPPRKQVQVITAEMIEMEIRKVEAWLAENDTLEDE